MGKKRDQENTRNGVLGSIDQIILPASVLLFTLFLFLALCLHMGEKNGLENVDLAAEPQWSLGSTMDGTYQGAWGNWLNDNFFGHTFVVKCRNQLQYSLFHDANYGRLLGKDNTLFEGSAYYNVLGMPTEERLDAYALQVAQLQAKLEAMGKDFVYLITPMKHEIYPELLPWNEQLIAEKYDGIYGSIRRTLEQAFDEYGVHYYDVTEDLIAMRGSAPYEIYSKAGHHWTLTTVVNEMNTVFENIKHMTPHVTYPRLEITELENELYPNDVDLLDAQNVFFGDEGENCQRPVIRISERSDSSVFLFGTSFSEHINNALEGEGNEAFRDFVLQGYFTGYIESADRIWRPATDTDPPSALRIMEHVQSSDLVIMEQYAGQLNETHERFAAYVLSNLDYLYYNLGDNAMNYTEDMAGIKLDGFYGLEPWGRWTRDECSVTVYGDEMENASEDIDLRLTMKSYYTDQDVEISVNGTRLTGLRVTPETDEYTITIPAGLIRPGENTIEFSIPGMICSPKSVGESDDVRYLGLGIESLVLEVSE